MQYNAHDMLLMSDRNKSPTNQTAAPYQKTIDIDTEVGNANSAPAIPKHGRQIHSPFYSLVLSRGYKSMRSFSKSAKISYSHLTHILCGTFSPRLATHERLASHLRINLDQLSQLIAEEVQWRRTVLNVQPSKAKVKARLGI